MAEGSGMDPDRLARIVQDALTEDLGEGDISGGSFGDTGAEGRVVAEDNIVLCGLPVAWEVFLQVDPDTSVEIPTSEGDTLAPGDVVLTCHGNGAALLAAERVALNFLQRMSGIATLTRRFVEAVDGTGVAIADTRKTTPGLRMMEKYAVRTGGGVNHRMGLYDQVLVKDNHIALAGGMAAAVERARAMAPEGVKVEVETTTLEEVGQALAVGADIIMLDNFDIATMREAVTMIDGRATVEASGGVNLVNVREIAETRVDVISIGRLTHSAASAEISMDILPAG